ncbi:phosphatases II [Auriscalpium vulgare]|uniref:Phosphatases II n=1 Tax=Auriscalpium vulgare TaxID=40419 RepID=A0ACB8RSP0_9AGAM|nr:phosphatases II [Auriscalpium vulgare]
MTAPQALAAVKAKRAVVNPNYGFQRQLHKYAARCRGEPEASVDQGTGSELTIAERIRLLTDSVPQDFERKANADEIVPRLYLSDLFTARSEADLERLGITHVLSVLDFHPVIPPHVVAVHIPLADRSDANILEHLDATTTFIRDALAAAPQNRVLVHCLMGISRSATVVCAYLVATTNMSPAQALAAVQAKRAVVNPNYSFQRQLRKYSARCCGEPEVLADPGTGSGSGSTVAERIRLLSGDEDATVSVAITSSTSASTRSTVASTSTDLVVDSRA